MATMISILLGRAAPYLLIATLLMGGITFFAAKGWLDEHRQKLEVSRSLDLARSSIEQASRTAARLRAASERATSRLEASEALLENIPTDDCFDSPMPSSGLLQQAISDTAAATSNVAP